MGIQFSSNYLRITPNASAADGYDMSTPMQINTKVDLLGQKCLVTEKTLEQLTEDKRFTLVAHVRCGRDQVEYELFCSAMELLDIFDYENRNPQLERKNRVLGINWVVLERDEEEPHVSAHLLRQTSRIDDVALFKADMNRCFDTFQDNVLTAEQQQRMQKIEEVRRLLQVAFNKPRYIW